MKHLIRNFTNCCLLALLVTLAACYDDKGNYNYRELGEISIENIPETSSILRGIGSLTIAPRIVSSTEGEITADNPNYEFGCRIARTSGSFADGEQWHDINPEKTQAFTITLDENIGEYVAVYSVTDLRTGVSTNHSFNITVITSTYEGWMVLCNEGADERVRLDMVSVLEEGNIMPIHDILGNGIPEQHGAKQLTFAASYTTDFIYMLTGTGTYSLDPTELTASETGNVLKSEFLADMGDELPERMAICGNYHYLVSNKGNIYRKQASSAGAAYEFPCNTTTDGADPTYHVSPYVAANGYLTLAYDCDNQRFVSQYIYASSTVFGGINEPTNPRFSWSTGRELLYMNTAGSIAYAVMQAPDGQRSIYAASLSGWTANNITQQGYWDNITAEGFREAEYFTFHPVYPYVFYAAGNTLHAYQLESGGNVSASLQLPGEEITMVKISPFRVYTPTGDRADWQNYILVGSYRNDATDDNGGILRMYDFDRTTNTFKEMAKYDGFAHIVDVTYRERG